MAASLTFLRRTQEEVNIFGGEVFVDIDGRNIGKIALSDFNYTVEVGVHTIKMYKSHTYDTFIGVAEVTLNVDTDEHLMLKYSAPMVVSQPGSIVVSPYSQQAAESEIQRRSNAISADYRVEQERKEESARKEHNAVLIIVVIIVVTLILWAINYSLIWNY